MTTAHDPAIVAARRRVAFEYEDGRIEIRSIEWPPSSTTYRVARKRLRSAVRELEAATADEPVDTTDEILTFDLVVETVRGQSCPYYRQRQADAS